MRILESIFPRRRGSRGLSFKVVVSPKARGNVLVPVNVPTIWTLAVFEDGVPTSPSESLAHLAEWNLIAERERK